MKKKIISLFYIVLVFSILAVNVTAAVPEDDSVQPRYTYIQDSSASVTLDGSTLRYSANVIGNSSTTQSTTIKVYLQYRTAGSSNSWANVYLETATGNWICTAGGTKATLSGYEYRIKAVITATGASSSETTTIYSNIV